MMFKICENHAPTQNEINVNTSPLPKKNTCQYTDENIWRLTKASGDLQKHI